jgi:uncharacterized protein YndB with AHSA1/START domain
MRAIETEVLLQSDAAEVWRRITDHEKLPQHTSFVRAVRVLDPQPGGTGTARVYARERQEIYRADYGMGGGP